MKRDESQKSNVRRLRKDQTPAETILWYQLRQDHFRNYKFRRQHPIGPYIVDFYCHQSLLVVELDGESHLSDEARTHDQCRSDYLISLGIHVERFWNHMISEHLESVLERIDELCQLRIGMKRKSNEIHSFDTTWKNNPRT